MTPDGRPFDHASAVALSARERLLLVCGRYEGIDERVRELGLYDEEISLGDFVLPGGESAALAVTEAVTRLVPGVIGASESLENESFLRERLDYPHYTRPREFRGLPVPEVLVGGDHARSSAGGAREPSPGPASGGRTCSPGAPGAGEGRRLTGLRSAPALRLEFAVFPEALAGERMSPRPGERVVSCQTSCSTSRKPALKSGIPSFSPGTAFGST
jgi:hypothetical protein